MVGFVPSILAGHDMSFPYEERPSLASQHLKMPG